MVLFKKRIGPGSNPSPLLASADTHHAGLRCRHCPMNAFFSETSHQGDKVARYKWSDPGSPGEFLLIDKHELHVDHVYQRSEGVSKIAALTKDFNWRAFGAVHVALRPDGKWFVFDGQHRVLAAIRRSDVKLLPCMVFELDTVEEEAESFLSVNTCRRPIGSLAKHKARVTASDPVALFLERCFSDLRLTVINTAACGGHIKCLTICYKLAAVDQDTFFDVLRLASDLSYAENVPVKESLLSGLFWLASRLPNGVNTPRFEQRVRQKGQFALAQAVHRAAALYARGGDRIFGVGILEELNKGLQRKFEIEARP